MACIAMKTILVQLSPCAVSRWVHSERRKNRGGVPCCLCNIQASSSVSVDFPLISIKHVEISTRNLQG
jgi:hypothetical protein